MVLASKTPLERKLRESYDIKVPPGTGSDPRRKTSKLVLYSP